jgi:hypothetical protein
MAKLTESQEEKCKGIPSHLRALYRAGVAGNRKSATRYACIECMGWVSSEVERCTSPACVWYEYRMTGVHAGKSAEASARAIASGRGFGPPSRETSGAEAVVSPDADPVDSGAREGG